MQIHMPPAETNELLRRLSTATCVLEYGAGGSTVAAAKSPSVTDIVSVETDAAFMKTVVDALPVDMKARLHAVTVNIGPTRRWGMPAKPGAHHAKFPNYVKGPWEVIESLKVRPDLVLVDGRFRIASFLYSLMNAPENSFIFFDDYERKSYRRVENIITPVTRVGRMAIFQVGAFDRRHALDMLLDHIFDPR